MEPFRGPLAPRPGPGPAPPRPLPGTAARRPGGPPIRAGRTGTEDRANRRYGVRPLPVTAIHQVHERCPFPPTEIAALGLVLAPGARHGPDRPIPVFRDGHRLAGDTQEILEATRVLADALVVVAGEFPLVQEDEGVLMRISPAIWAGPGRGKGSTGIPGSPIRGTARFTWIAGLFSGFIQGKAEKSIGDVQARGSERLQRVANRTDGPESVAGQDQADGADARETQPGRLATRGMVIEHHLPTRMFEGDGENGDLPRVEISRSEDSGNRRCRKHAQPIRRGLRHQGDRRILGSPPENFVQDGTRRNDLDVRSRFAQQVESPQLREHDQGGCVNDAHRASAPARLSVPPGSPEAR